MRITATVALLVGIALVFAGPQRAQSTTRQASNRTGNYAELLKAIHIRHKVAVLSDIAAGEEDVQHVSTWESAKSGQDALEALAQLTNRTVLQMNGLYVLRHKRWAVGQEWAARPTSRRYPTGSIKLIPVDRPADTGFALPAQFVSVSAVGASCGSIVELMRKRGDWSVRVDPAVAPRQVVAFAERIAPSLLLGGIAYLLNSGPEVVLRPSKEQLAYEALDALELPDDMKKRKIASDPLRARLAALMTPEQKRQLESGEFVPFTVGELPTDLRKQALDYLKLCYQNDSKIIPPPDWDKSMSFQVRMTPQNAGKWWSILSAMTLSEDGSRYFF